MAKQAPKRTKSRAPTAAPRKRPRASREKTTEEILDAAEKLFAERHPSDVTVRDIAEKAGVTHALVHQYIGTKEDLLNAVIQRVATNRVALVRRSNTLDEALQAIADQILTNRVHSKSLVRSAMDGVEYVSLNERIRTGHALIELTERMAASGAAPVPAPNDIGPQVLVAAISALLFGWAATEDWAWHIFDLDPDSKDEIYRQLGEIVAYLENLALKPAGPEAAK